MKRIQFLIIPFLFVSCTHYVQLFETKTTSPMKIEKNSFTFENDTVKIVYSFWAANGNLSYTVFNKLDIPIYIDWKKSSYVKNSQKLDYWIDMATTNSTSKGHSTLSYGVVYGTSYNNSTTIKPEQIVFIAPKSTITKDQFILLPATKADLSKNSLTTTINRTDNPKKMTKVKYIDFSIDNSILIFRNFLTISTSDKFDKESYVDNGFYISKVSEMDDKIFWGNAYAKTDYWKNRNNITPPFQNPKDFYIIVK